MRCLRSSWVHQYTHTHTVTHPHTHSHANIHTISHFFLTHTYQNGGLTIEATSQDMREDRHIYIHVVVAIAECRTLARFPRTYSLFFPSLSLSLTHTLERWPCNLAHFSDVREHQYMYIYIMSQVKLYSVAL